jgi:hypothetical protein
MVNSFFSYLFIYFLIFTSLNYFTRSCPIWVCFGLNPMHGMKDKTRIIVLSNLGNQEQSEKKKKKKNFPNQPGKTKKNAKKKKKKKKKKNPSNFCLLQIKILFVYLWYTSYVYIYFWSVHVRTGQWIRILSCFGKNNKKEKNIFIYIVFVSNNSYGYTSFIASCHEASIFFFLIK